MNQTSSDSSYLIFLKNLLSNGYNDVVKEFTNSIQSNQNAVLRFEKFFDLLNHGSLIHWEGTSSQAELLIQVDDCHEEMKEFLGALNYFKSFLKFINHGQEATFEIGWIDKRIGPVVWDRWTCCIDDAVITFADIGYMFDSKEYICASKPTEKPEPPLYRYHPERFKAYRDYAELIGKFYRQKVESRSGIMTVDQLNEAMSIVVSELNRRSMKFPRKLKDTHPRPSLVIKAEETLATAYGRFVQAGSQIMDFPPALTEMLAKTDIDDIPLNSIKLPYASQYMHFGAQNDLEIEPGWVVDGAYVEQRGANGDLRFTITAMPNDHSLSRKWYLLPEAEYTQDFVGDFRSMDLATAIDTFLSNELAELKISQTKKGGDITDSVQSEFCKRGENMPDGMRVINVRPEMAIVREEITRRRFPIYKTALQLVVNSLCYVAAYPDDIDSVWPEGAPDSLKQKVLKGKGKEQVRAKSKLAALGYVPVHICGKRVVEQRSIHGIHAQENGHVAVHWRRGHWRNQVHGPGRSLRKLIWVMPVIVGTNSHEEPESGHLYLIRGEEPAEP